MMITRAITVSRLLDRNIDKIRLNQSVIIEKVFAQITQEKFSAGFQSPTQKQLLVQIRI